MQTIMGLDIIIMVVPMTRMTSSAQCGPLRVSDSSLHLQSPSDRPKLIFSLHHGFISPAQRLCKLSGGTEKRWASG